MQPTNPNFPTTPQASDPTTETSDNSHELPITKTNVQQYADEVLDCDKRSGGQLLSPEQRETLQSFIDYLRLPGAWEQLPPDAEETDEATELAAYNKFRAGQEKFGKAASARNIDEFAKTVEATEASTEITISNPTSVEAVVQQATDGPARRIAAKYLTSIREQPPAGVNQEDCVLDTQYVARRIAEEIVQQIVVDPNLRGLDHNRLMVEVGDLMDTSDIIARDKLNLPPAIEAVWGGRARQTLTAAAYQLANYNNLFFTIFAQNEEPERALRKAIDEQCGVKTDIAQSPIVTAILAEQDQEKRVDFQTAVASAESRLVKASSTQYIEEKKRAASTVYQELQRLVEILNDGQKPAADTYTLLTQAYNETVQNFVRRLVPTYGSTDYDEAFANQYRDYIIHSIATVRLQQANQELSESRAALAPTIDRIVQYAEANNPLRQAERSDDPTLQGLAGMVTHLQKDVDSLNRARDALDMDLLNEQARSKRLQAQIQEQQKQIWEQAKRIKQFEAMQHILQIESYDRDEFLNRPLIIGPVQRGTQVVIQREGQSAKATAGPMYRGSLFREYDDNVNISRSSHAVLIRNNDGGLTIGTRQGTSGISVNGVHHDGTRAHVGLNSGDIVTIGSANQEKAPHYICITLNPKEGPVLLLLPPFMVEHLKNYNETQTLSQLTPGSPLMDAITRIVKRTLRDEDDRIQAAKAVKLQEELQVRELGQKVNSYRQALSAIEKTLNTPTIFSLKPIVDGIKSIVADMKRIDPQEPNR